MDFFDLLKNNKIIILSISLIFNVILLIATIILIVNLINYKCVCDNNSTKLVCENTDLSQNYFVEIKGAVKNPSVYEVNDTNIINDVVEKAGGFTKKAYTKNINLSRKLTDELVIYVYTESEYKKKTQKNENIVQEVCECSTYVIDNCTENAVSEIVASDKDTTFAEDNSTNNKEESNKININTANVNELTTLSGIGESRANDIIEYRTTNGNFKSIEEIKNVSGIGDSLFEKIKDYITI